MSEFPARRALRLLTCLLALAAPARAAETAVAFTVATTPPTQIRGLLDEPKGAGPFAAVAVLPSCLGLAHNRRDLAQALTKAGFVALFVDDFTTRGLKQTCAVDFPEALPDALAAYDYLTHRRDVDPRRIAALGFSQGGDTALRLAEGSKFRAAAAYYPPCANLDGARLTLPTLILIGAKDDVTPAGDCRGLEAETIVYPDARHLFDDPAFAGGKRLYGMLLQYDARSAKAARAELMRFLKANLGPP